MGTCDGAGGPGPGDKDTAPQPEEPQNKPADGAEPGEWTPFDIPK